MKIYDCKPHSSAWPDTYQEAKENKSIIAVYRQKDNKNSRLLFLSKLIKYYFDENIFYTSMEYSDELFFQGNESATHCVKYVASIPFKVNNTYLPFKYTAHDITYKKRTEYFLDALYTENLANEPIVPLSRKIKLIHHSWD